jgi:hypothetical protein
MSATVSLASEPGYLAPVNAEMWYNLTSASASQITDYKYIIDVWKLNQVTGVTSSRLGRFKVPPRPDNYDCDFSVNKVLKSQISNLGSEIIIPTASTAQTVNDLYTRYTIQYGFEYNPELAYYDFVNSPSFGIAFTYNPQLRVNDIITINKTNYTLNPQYNGIHTVGTYSSGTVSIPGLTFGAYFVGLDGTFGSSTPIGADGGIVSNLIRVTGTASKRLGYNGTRQYEQINVDFTDDYLLTQFSTEAKFLTNYVGYKPVKALEYETQNIMAEVPTTLWYLVLRTYDSTNTLIQTYTHSCTFSTTLKYYTIPVGTANLTGTFLNPNLFNNVYRYDLSIWRTSQFSEYIYREIDRSCSLYEDVRVVFLNRMGGYDYWTFDKDNKKTVNINRTEYKKVLRPVYSFSERGQTTLSQDVQHTFSLNSNWISESDYAYLEELISSPNVYIVRYFDGALIPINITDTSYSVKTQLRDKLFNLTINYKLSYGINIQNQ